MKSLSIKTVDGNRFDFLDKEGRFDNLEQELEENSFLCFPVDCGQKLFNIDRIVSVSVKEVING
jgi:hypothetical protein